LIFVLCAPAAMPAQADALADAQAVYDGGDFTTALKLLRPLAEQGNAGARYRLGNMYMFGEGQQADLAKAVQLYQLAADQDLPNAQFTLGFMHLNGIGIGQDNIQALKWFLICARHPGFKYFAGKNAELAETRMTQAQIAEARKLAREWKPK
jgi:uncharacterized protein